MAPYRGEARRERGKGRGLRFLGVWAGGVLGAVSLAAGGLGPADVLILVNAQSPTSRYVARLYRGYHPEVGEDQVLELGGLADCSGPTSTPASEIVTREQYETLVAGPVRAYLSEGADPERLGRVKALVTTAGLPYRIKDSNPSFANAVYAAGSNAQTVVAQESSIDAATVESELTCLWYSNVGSNPFGLMNRMVNPYQGYRGSSVTLFPREYPDGAGMSWALGYSNALPQVECPVMEGVWPTGPWSPPYTFGTTNRHFHAGNMYLTCRLDGPKAPGKSAVFAVRSLLERARRASDPARGVNPGRAAAVLDDARGQTENYDNNRTYNLTSGVDYWVYEAAQQQPPDAAKCRIKEDYQESYRQLTGQSPADGLNLAESAAAWGVGVALDRRVGTTVSVAELEEWAAGLGRPAGQLVVALASYGVNGDEGRTSGYLLTGGAGGGALYGLANGAVFSSLESFNAVTMFSGVATQPAAQGKLVDFITIGGSGAIGHAFEPQPDAAIDNEFLFYNLLADQDGDGRADLTFVEAAFTAIPYLSWAEVVIGDPLMRIAYGPGGRAWGRLPGDVNNDGRVNYVDVCFVKARLGGALNASDPVAFGLYDDLSDINQDGIINYVDVCLAKGYLGTVAGP